MSQPTRPAPPFSPGLAVWFAMLGSVVFYAGIVLFVGGARVEGPLLPWWPFAVAGIVCAWLALLFHRGIGERSRSERRTVETASPLVDPAYVRVWALDEAVGVIGLVAALFGGGIPVFVPFGVAAVALLLLHRPR